jgi:DNA-binding MarR family transcriptional regulator
MAREPDSVDRIQLAWTRERPGTPVESIGLITRVWRAGKLLADDRRRTLARLGIDAATLDLLSTLRRHGEPYRMTPAELKEACLVSAGAISQRVARAEASGFVRAHRGGGGRTTAVELTAGGHGLIEGSVDELLRHEQTLVEHLTPAEREQLTGLLRTLLDGLTSRLAEPGPAGDPPDPGPR